MKRIVLAVVAASLASPAFAFNWDFYHNDEDRRAANESYTRAEQIFNRLDADKNGVLNVRESQALGEKSYRIDRNEDEQISLAELSQDLNVNSSANWKDWGYNDTQAREQRTVR